MSTATTDLLDLILLTQPAQPPPAKMADPKDAETCPVDHKAREAWLQHARAAAPNDAATPPAPPDPDPAPAADDAVVDAISPLLHALLRDIITDDPGSNKPAPPTPTPLLTPRPPAAVRPPSPSATALALHDILDTNTPLLRPLHLLATSPSRSAITDGKKSTRHLPRTTIPRTSTSSYPYDAPSASAPPPTTLQSSHGAPSNNEQETGADAATGNWVYPSEKMFFEAMKRKGHDTRAADMRTVVPIHNAVNERAWKEIKEWEVPYTQGTACDGPRLHSFAGLSTNMSPKARLNTLLGYQAPFDRHDWVIDRCGVQVDYVIDFYAGRPDAQGKPSFYLDVRPKLNSWEGVKMRALRGAGLA
uniref:Holocytochrome c-type synthase n=1 Tax=Colletotrichum fructicola (strain Nara gc5) TaxID=1213859 RepID=L2FDC0_COLFN